MTVADSSVWIEHLQGSPRAQLFRELFADPAAILVPAIVIYEVHRLIASKGFAEAADAAIALMSKGKVCAVDGDLAVLASELAREHRMAMADAMIYATSVRSEAELWTQDAHFKGLPGVHYIPKP